MPLHPDDQRILECVWIGRSGNRRILGGRLQKRCSDCGRWKLLDELATDKTALDGLRATCKLCANATWERQKMDREQRLKVSA